MTPETIVAAGTAIAAIAGAILAGNARKHAKDTNDAVNHRHLDEPRLYDMVLESLAHVRELVQWKKGYEGGPLDTGRKVDNFVTETQKRLGEIENQLENGK